MLTEQELYVLKTIEKLMLINIKQLAILSGKKSLSAARKTVRKLIEKGYVVSYNQGNHLVYTASQKGLSFLGINRRAQTVKGFSSIHTETVASAACFLYIKNRQLSIKDMIFDNEIRKIERFRSGHFFDDNSRGRRTPDHAPDIIVSPHICVECELNIKQLARLKHNFKDNYRNFDKQIWIVPQRLNSLINNLSSISSDFDSDIQLFTVEKVEEVINSYDLTINAYRKDSGIETPTPLEVKKHRKKVILHD